ncbi:MAG: nucleotidyl transferase AbiEii/AbiGii toxin family protein, partial [Gammaproteobacteria bacterium]
GGTSLSKTFNLIERFSEDVDVTIDYRNFIDPIDFTKISRTQLKKAIDKLIVSLKDFVANTVFPFIIEKAKQEFPNHQIKISLTDDSESLQFYYPTSLTGMDASQSYLLDHVLIEFGVKNTTEPSDKCLITALLIQALESPLLLPSAHIDTLSPIRTFWEKATLIHVACNRGKLVQSPARLSRHWYDLAILSKSWVGQSALKDKVILNNVVQHKKAFFHASQANYDECLTGNFRLIPNNEEQEILEKDFHQMQHSGMFRGAVPAFIEIMNTLQELEIVINHKT